MGKRKYIRIQAIESKLLEMRTEGKSRREIAKELGLSLKQIENWITAGIGNNARSSEEKRFIPKVDRGIAQ